MITLDSQTCANQKARVLICDDHRLIRQALRDIINRQSDMEVVAEASDGQEAVLLAQNLKPTAILMDIEMPLLSGVDATRRIRDLLPEAIVIALTVHDSAEYVLGILEAGATGYLTKSAMSGDVPAAIRAAIRGESILSRESLQKLTAYVSQYVCVPTFDSCKPRLTIREREMLNMVARGCSNKMIASYFNYTENTVKKYMKIIFDKLDVRSRTAAVMVAQSQGLLQLDDSSAVDKG
jgi:NarL family two-component system response regulator LiaR